MVSFLQKIIGVAALWLTIGVSAEAQTPRFKRGDCLGAVSEAVQPGTAAQGIPALQKKIPAIKTQWDSTRVYPVAVVLMNFTDRDFLADGTRERYDSIFNLTGYNEGKGPGCVADYFRAQSGGLFKPHFDIYGPIQASGSCKSGDTYGSSLIREVCQTVIDGEDFDLSKYDWDGNGEAEAFVIVYAGYGGNEDSSESAGTIWSNTGSMSYIQKDNTKLRYYSASNERYTNDKRAGIGTICHEYAHTLGLPDIYPTKDGDVYSICDMWDLMDGGNYINNGWCPCNFTGLEKMLLGWAKPEELTDPTQITNMKAISEGGTFYRVSSTEDEYYLLENRQWSGWDLRTPGHGLLIFHVDYNASAWKNNTPNNQKGHRRFDIIHADNIDCVTWTAIVGANNPYVNGHSRILSTSPYPYITEDTINNQLTDTSVPAAVVFNSNGFMGKSITNITESEDGLISFDFMWNGSDGIQWVADEMPASNYRQKSAYNLKGQRATKRDKLQIIKGKKVVTSW